MSTTTFKQRLKLAKAKLREKEAAGEPVIVMRSWSDKSLEGFRKALRGGSVQIVNIGHTKHQVVKTNGR
jgi:hypothetical protein